MARIEPLSLEQAKPAAHKQLEEQIAAHGRATNMKRTLAHAPAALHAFMHWYDLHAEVVKFLGPLGHAVCPCHLQPDRLPDLLHLLPPLVDRSAGRPGQPASRRPRPSAGRVWPAAGRDANAVRTNCTPAWPSISSPPQIVTLTAFGGLMIATNVFNNALRVDLDEYLFPFRKGAPPMTRHEWQGRPDHRGRPGPGPCRGPGPGTRRRSHRRTGCGPAPWPIPATPWARPRAWKRWRKKCRRLGVAVPDVRRRRAR